MNIELQKFNINSIDRHESVLIIGKPLIGKSILTKDIMYHYRNITTGIVISSNKSYSTIIPDIFIHNNYDENLISNFINIQRQRQMYNINNKLLINQDKEENTEENKEENTEQEQIELRKFLILDDCIYVNSWSKSEDIKTLFMNGKHYNIFFILTMQYVINIPPNLRANIDYIFILKENIIRNQKKLYDCYANMFPSLEVFSQVLEKYTQNFECLVIDNTSKSTEISDKVFWYKAEVR